MHTEIVNPKDFEFVKHICIATMHRIQNWCPLKDWRTLNWCLSHASYM